MKRCGRCKLTKLKSAFSKRGKSRDGLQSWCKLCIVNHVRDLRQTKGGMLSRKDREMMTVNSDVRAAATQRMIDKYQAVRDKLKGTGLRVTHSAIKVDKFLKGISNETLQDLPEIRRSQSMHKVHELACLATDIRRFRD